MKLKVVGSGSKGNGYLLTNGNETLVLETGCRFIDVKKALNFKIMSLVGAVSSHSHLDHVGYAHEYELTGVPVWKPYLDDHLRQVKHFGGFNVMSFGLQHNVPCCGFLVGHKDMGKLLYVSDTEYVKYKFRNLSVMLIEANYDDRYLNKDEAKYRHVISDHMGLSTTIDCIRANASDFLHTVVLCHLSETNADPDAFIAAVKEVVPPGVQVYVASPGLEVNLDEVPFLF